jgi:hypothetical protein
MLVQTGSSACEAPEEVVRNMSALVVRVLRGATCRFGLRKQDWFLASMLATFGVVLLVDDGRLNTVAAWDHLWKIASPRVWGWMSLIIGTIRLCALLVNGTFQSFRWSPHIRLIAAALTCFMWFNLVLGIMLAGVMTTAAAIYPHLLVFELYNVYAAAQETGLVETSHRNGCR